jgi:4-hydroxybenzoate polyprenyltransferase
VSAIVTLFRLGRPRTAPWVLGIVLFGWAFAHWDHTLVAETGLELLRLCLAWTFLGAGTVWLNAALDGEEDAVIFAERTPVPPYVAAAGYVALAVGVLVASTTTRLAWACATTSALMAVLYSHPRANWKGHPWGGPFINVLGAGLLTPIAGWALAEAPFSVRWSLTLLAWSLWMAGAYFAAQAFQEEEDRRRGYRTLVVTHGPRRTLITAFTLMSASIALAFTLSVVGVYPRLTLLGYPLFLRAVPHMRAWLAEPNGGTPEDAVRLYKRMVSGGLVLFALAYVDYWLT